MHADAKLRSQPGTNFAVMSSLKNGLLNAAGSILNLAPASPWISRQAGGGHEKDATDLALPLNGNSRKAAGPASGSARSGKRGRPRKSAAASGSHQRTVTDPDRDPRTANIIRSALRMTSIPRKGLLTRMTRSRRVMTRLARAQRKKIPLAAFSQVLMP
jgi:hypothetical protein